MYYIMNERSMLSIWNKLEAKHMKKAIDNHAHLKNKIFQFDYTRGRSLGDHVNNFNKIILCLKSLEVQVDDEDKAILLLNSLLESYKHLSTMLIYWME